MEFQLRETLEIAFGVVCVAFALAVGILLIGTAIKTLRKKDGQ